MKISKGLIMVLVILLMMTAVFPIGIVAKIGDASGTVLKTDIVTYINNYPIPSFVINEKTAIIAEDLRFYGFDVVWNNDERSLIINRNSETNINPVPTKKAAKGEIGKQLNDTFETDIKVFLGENEVECFALHSYTAIYVDSLEAYGLVQWVDWMRALKVWIEDGLIMKEAPEPVEEEVTASTESVGAEKAVAGLKREADGSMSGEGVYMGKNIDDLVVMMEKGIDSKPEINKYHVADNIDVSKIEVQQQIKFKFKVIDGKNTIISYE